MDNFCRVIIVDDEYTLLQGMKHLLDWEREGFRIAGTAENGSEALQLIERVHPHIVITDIVMPLLDGVELTRLIKLKFPKTVVIILSSYSEFDYVKSAFKFGAADYILKPRLDRSSLLSVLNKAKATFHEFVSPNGSSNIPRPVSYVLNQLINGFSSSGDEETKSMLQRKIEASEYFIVCCDSPALKSNTENGFELIDSIVVPYMKESIKGCDITSGVTEGKTYFLLIGAHGLAASRLNEALSSLGRHLDSVALEDTCFSISRQVTSLSLFSRIYQEAQSLLSYKFYGSTKVFSGSSVNLSPEPEFDSESFTQSLDFYDLNRAFTFIEKYVQDITEGLSLEPYILKKNLQSIIYNTFKLFETPDVQFDNLKIFKLELFKKIDMSKDIKEMLAEIRNAFSFLEGLSVEMKSPKLMKQIYLYVKNNYMHEIYLSDVAKDLHISYTYLSSYFNANEQKTFSDYLNCIRVEKAKEFLKDPDISISMVSELCGYSDQSYFGKVFKKSTGYTPTEYRRKYRSYKQHND